MTCLLLIVNPKNILIYNKIIRSYLCYIILKTKNLGLPNNRKFYGNGVGVIF